MLRPTFRLSGVFSVLAAVALSLVIAPVVAADTSISESGVTGTHHLRDTKKKPGVTCKYTTTYNNQAWAGKLARLRVQPPKVFAASGTQKVGWRFMAQRKRGSGAWETTYTSPTTKMNATTGTMADFSRRSINVVLPADYGDANYYYRVQVEMFWYNAGGSVTGSSVHRVNYYKRIYGNFEYKYRKGICGDNEAIAP